MLHMSKRQLDGVVFCSSKDLCSGLRDILKIHVGEDAQKGVLETLRAEGVVPEVHIHLSLPCTVGHPCEYVMLSVMQPPCAHASNVTLCLSPCLKMWTSFKGLFVRSCAVP